MRIVRIAAGVLALACLPPAAAYTPASHPASLHPSSRAEAAPGAESQTSSRRPGRRVTVTGRLTGEGAECQAFRSKGGTLYTLTGNLRGFRAGDKVRVVGRVAEVSTCMQGTTLVLESIKRAE